MSAPAIKSSMPGVGANPSTTGHSMLPMNMMAQKVVQGTETSTMKPMTGSSLSYVTLQPASQPLSLVQDHRPAVYQAPPMYAAPNVEKEVESNAEKLSIPNGLEVTKTESEQPAAVSIKPSEASKNNSNLESITQEQQPQQPQSQQQHVTQPSPQLQQQSVCSEGESMAVQLGNQTSNTHLSSKVEDKKLPANSSLKEVEEGSQNTMPVMQNKILQIHKTEDSLAKVESPQKPKTPVQSLPAKSENNAAQVTSTTPKSEPKTSSQPVRANKRKQKETAGQGGFENAFKPKRRRRRTEPFQSPLPEIAMIVKTLSKPTVSKANDDKLIVFYKNEFLAVRNTEGSFYVCQAMQNIYKSSRRIRIRWLSQDKTNGEIYSPDFYDFTDFDCILTNLNLNKIDKNKFQLTKLELLRTENILKRAIDVEAGVSEKPSVTEEHPDGLDLSLYKDESQLKKRKGGSNKQKRQRKRGKRSSSSGSEEDEDSESDEETEKKAPAKTSQAKKRSTNKALAIAKSVAKGSSRAERALNRGNKSADSINNLPAAGKSDSNKKSTDAKKVEAKKALNKPQSNNASGTSRIKSRGGNTQTTQESKSATSRPKRGATSGVSASSEENAPRKKSRGRA